MTDDDFTRPPDSPSFSAGGPGAGGAGDSGAAERTGSGLEENLAGALSYLLGPVTGVLFLILDKERPFVRFHAVQCLVASVVWLALSLAFMVLSAILGIIPVLGFIVSTLAYLALSILGFVLWLVLMYKAFRGEEWEIPVIGEHARRYAARV